MASTNTIWSLKPGMRIPTSTLGARLGKIVDLSTPAANLPTLRFDPTTAWWAYWLMPVPSKYSGGGFTISMKSGTDNTSVGDFRLDVGIMVIADTAILSGDLGFDSMATKAALTDTPPATPINKLNYCTPVTLSHAAAGSPAIDQLVGISAVRNVAADSNTGFLQLVELLIKET